MRQPPRLALLLATLVTASIVTAGVGIVATSGWARSPGEGSDGVTAVTRVNPDLARLVPGDRAEAVAWRGPGRDKVLPPFRVRKAGAPLTLKPPPPPPPPPRPPAPRPTVADPFTFQIGTLNVLGSQHTRGSRRYAPGTVRTARASGLIRTRGVDLLGLQEVQGDQLNVLYNQLPGYSIWPGRALGGNGVRLQIAFRSDLFELMDAGSIMTRFDFLVRPIPYVLLRDRATGGEFWVVNIHNSPRTQEMARDSATVTEIALFNRLRGTGRPVLVTGDMNEKAEWFCKVAVGASMVAANGGSGSGGCVLPPGPLRIDWIMGGGGVDFYGYVQDGASLAGISDHFFVHATVTVYPTNLVRNR